MQRIERAEIRLMSEEELFDWLATRENYQKPGIFRSWWDVVLLGGSWMVIAGAVSYFIWEFLR